MAPEVVDWSERHMRLSWNEPIDDGGAPITGYHVEAKAKTDEEWQVYYKLLRHYPHSMTAANNKARLFVSALGHSGHQPDHSRHAEAAKGQGVPIQNYCHQQSWQI